jgi:hypothetical protein
MDSLNGLGALNETPAMQEAAPSPSLNLSPEQLSLFGFEGLPEGATVTAQVTFRVSGADELGGTSLEVQNVENVMPDEAEPPLPAGAPPEPELGEPEISDPMSAEDEALGASDEQSLGYARPPKKKKPGFPVDMAKLQGR